MRFLRLLGRHRYTATAAAMVACALVGDHHEGDLEYFWIAEHLLFHGEGLSTYVTRPDLQIGPLALLGGSLLSAVSGPYFVFASIVAALAMLLLTVRTLAGLSRDAGADVVLPDAVLTVGGLALAASWAVVVPGWGHLDDLGAMLALVASVRAIVRGEGLRAGLLLAVAADCKPWGLFASAMVVALPGSAQRIRATGALLLGIATCWLPFVLGARRTISALGGFRIVTHAGSLPYLLGYTTTDPSWIRAAQLGLASAMVLVCVRWRRTDLMLLCVAIARLLLDGGTYPYYDAELVLGALVADVIAAGHRPTVAGVCLPTAVFAWIGIDAVHHVTDLRVALIVRSAVYLLALGAAALRGRPTAWPHDVSSRAVPPPVGLNSTVVAADI